MRKPQNEKLSSLTSFDITKLLKPKRFPSIRHLARMRKMKNPAQNCNNKTRMEEATLGDTGMDVSGLGSATGSGVHCIYISSSIKSGEITF
jgi:hypothetical protein